jgi:replicative DNA helicase
MLERAEQIHPHDLEAEKGVLGAILIDNNLINNATELLRADHFYRDAHVKIFDRMIYLADRSQPIDLVTLVDALRNAGELERVGGPAYVSSLTDGVPRATNVQAYARIVKEKSTLRRLILAASRIQQQALSNEKTVDSQLDEAERSIFEIAEDRQESGFVSLASMVDSSYQILEKLQSQKGAITGVPSGFHDLDELTSGFQPSDLVIVAARPSMGKTSFVMNIAMNAARDHGKTVGIFSLEMAKIQLFLRILTSEARVDAHRFRTGFLGDQDYDKLAGALAGMHECSVYIDDTPSISVLEMRAKSRRLKLEHGLDLLIIDYIQLMQGSSKFESRQQELASISRSLKILAKELEVPILVLSQLSRASETRADHRPQLSDLRESGALEQDADVVMFIFREEMYLAGEVNHDLEGKATIIVGKQRNGPIGDVDLAFLKQFTRFENLAEKRLSSPPPTRALPESRG